MSIINLIYDMVDMSIIDQFSLIILIELHKVVFIETSNETSYTFEVVLDLV